MVMALDPARDEECAEREAGMCSLRETVGAPEGAGRGGGQPGLCEERPQRLPSRVHSQGPRLSRGGLLRNGRLGVGSVKGAHRPRFLSSTPQAPGPRRGGNNDPHLQGSLSEKF